ncbi:MAG: prepilin-type N-terminal cleavage/methylation domain-containing protein [Fibrobacterales bacterium]
MMNKGFTLIEVLVAIALLSIGIAGVNVIFVNSAVMESRSYRQLAAFSHLHNRVEYILANPQLPLVDSLWIADTTHKLVLWQRVIDTVALDSMADLYIWETDDVERLYKRPKEIRYGIYRYEPEENDFEEAFEDVDPEYIEEGDLRLLMNIEVVRDN